MSKRVFPKPIVDGNRAKPSALSICALSRPLQTQNQTLKPLLLVIILMEYAYSCSSDK